MTSLFLSCEHGGNVIPPKLAPLFRDAQDVLRSHRGLDIGALDLFNYLDPLAMVSTHATRSRLCIELNRSLHHPQLFSTYTRAITAAQRKELLRYHHAYRAPFTSRIAERLKLGEEVVHVSVHSFTPIMNKVVRKVDIGLLYDPSIPREKQFCGRWRTAINRRMPLLRVAMNRPYKGTSDGFTTALRKQFPQGYAGIELEVNQRFAKRGRMDAGLKKMLRASLAEVLKQTS